ncbi:hypothetical protein A0256_15075 [Mucilaginibacter sp. PAMC 26640]|nr:hypothetical protein A0256_15075 [Mucilaginibacter sp. PAMC 26640]
MKIQIMGASCAGSTTLGHALSERLRVPYFDTDDYFWERTDVPYTVKRDPQLRNQQLLEDMLPYEHWILGGSVINWGKEWEPMFDLVVFLYLPTELRMERLQAREVSRYGDAIFNDPVRHQLYLDFIAWAAKYDDITFSGRNIKAHEDWLQRAKTRVLEIRGDTRVQERIELVTNFIHKNGLH